MLYAQFYQRGVLTGNLIEACGDRAVIVLDGRVASSTLGAIAASECERRDFVAWQIFKGESFTRSAPVSPINYVQHTQPVRNPVWLSAHGM
jgi:hypothetical protein